MLAPSGASVITNRFAISSRELLTEPSRWLIQETPAVKRAGITQIARPKKIASSKGLPGRPKSSRSKLRKFSTGKAIPAALPNAPKTITPTKTAKSARRANRPMEERARSIHNDLAGMVAIIPTLSSGHGLTQSRQKEQSRLLSFFG